MRRRDLFRRTLGVALASASQAVVSAREFPPDYDASKDLARADWKPQFLDDHQNQTLIAFSDILIPETDTPGAKAALVNRFLDRLLAADTRSEQRKFIEALAYADGAAFERHQAAFVYLTPEQQSEIVRVMAEPVPHKQFTHLKDQIARAYYASESGMRALGYDGPPHGELPGCK